MPRARRLLQRSWGTSVVAPSGAPYTSLELRDMATLPVRMISLMP